MYSTSELDELFQILNSVNGFKLNNHKGATQQYVLPITYCMMQKYTPGMFLTDFHTQKYTRGIFSRVGIFLTVTPAM